MLRKGNSSLSDFFFRNSWEKLREFEEVEESLSEMGENNCMLGLQGVLTLIRLHKIDKNCRGF